MINKFIVIKQINIINISQVAERREGGHPTVRSVARQLMQQDGPRGFFRGLLPRMANVALWGTCMINAYEFLKRVCALPEEGPAPKSGADELLAGR